MDLARSLWVRIETLHAVTYFGNETTDVARAQGLSGFWAGYFGFRAAPLGTVSAGVVEATFFNFAGSFVERWVPAVWEQARPGASVEARTVAAAATLRRVCPDIEAVAQVAEPVLAAAVARARWSAAGRPLFAANRTLALPDDPVARLWQQCTTLREHRGDGHVAALTVAGVDGLQAHVLIALEQGTSPDDLQRTRGWTADDWTAAVDRCRVQGWVDGGGDLTDAGRRVRAQVEATTDALAARPFEDIGSDGVRALLAALGAAAAVVSCSGIIRYPNPMGLPVAHDHVRA